MCVCVSLSLFGAHSKLLKFLAAELACFGELARFFCLLAYVSMALAQTKLDSGALKTTVQIQPETGPHQAKQLPPGPTDTAGMEEIDYESLPTDRLSVHLLAGAAAGTFEHCAMYPVDCVKVIFVLALLKYQHNSLTSLPSRLVCHVCSFNNISYSNTVMQVPAAGHA